MREDATGKQPAVQGSSKTAHEAGISCPRKGTQSGRRSRGEHPGSASAFPAQIGRTASPSFPGGTRLFAAAVYDRRAVLVHAMVMLLPPTLEKGQQQTLNTNIDVMCISASSKKQEAAKAFVAYCAKHLDQMTQYEIHPSLTAPIESTTYKARLETLNSELNDLQDRYAKEENDEKKYTLEDEITAKQEMIASVEDGKWAISPESIEIYRKAAEQMTIPYQSKFSSNGSDGFGMLSDVILQYCADGLEESEVNALIQELNRVADMVYMENH